MKSSNSTADAGEVNPLRTRKMTSIALMTAVICVMGPLSLPIGPVPISLCNLAIMITMYILGTKAGTIATCLYVLIGFIGLPVYSGFSGGAGKLFGPTGGYIIGWIPLALISGLVIDRYWKKPIISILGMIAGTVVLYIMGTAWLAYSAGMTYQAALAAGVIPFIPLDLIKMVISAIIGPVLKKRLAPIIGAN